MNFDDLVDELLDRYVVTEVNRTPFTAEEDEEEKEEDCEDCGCEEDNEEPKGKKTFAAKWKGKFPLDKDHKDDRSKHILKDGEKDDSELSDEDTSEDG